MESQLILRTADRKRNLTVKKLLRVHIVTARALTGSVRGAPCFMHKVECLKHSAPWTYFGSRIGDYFRSRGSERPFYTARSTAKIAREGRSDQRAADGYLRVLSLAEQEARWLDANTFNLGRDQESVRNGEATRRDVPKQPAVTDKATASALIAAFASPWVWARHTAWREAADVTAEKIGWIFLGMSIDSTGATFPTTG